MLFHIGDLYRLKGAIRNMQGNKGLFDAVVFKPLKKLFGKVKACGGRCGGAFNLSKNRLVINPVYGFFFPFKVRRDGYFPVLVKSLKRVLRYEP